MMSASEPAKKDHVMAVHESNDPNLSTDPSSETPLRANMNQESRDNVCLNEQDQDSFEGDKENLPLKRTRKPTPKVAEAMDKAVDKAVDAQPKSKKTSLQGVW